MNLFDRARSYFRLDAHDDPDPTPDPTPDPAPDPKPEDRTFTQAELDRIVQDRLARDRQKYSDYDDLKTKAEQFDKLQADQQTELEKEQAARAKAEEERTKALDTANTRLVRAEVKAIATDLKVVDPDAAYLLMDRAEVKVDDAGNVVGVKEALAKLIEAKPYLTGDKNDGKPAGSADAGAKPEGAEADFRKAKHEDFAAEMAKHGLRPRTQ